MKYKEIILRMEDGIATLTLNRPEKKNALSYRLCDEICDAVDEVANNDEARVFVLTGAGSAFSAGGDLETHPATIAKDRETRIKHLRHSVQAASKLRSLKIPLIGSINGPALGAGCDIACACDIRIVSEKATFGEIHIRVGFVPDFGGAYFLPRLVGMAKTCELIFTGDPIDAYEAERIGLANKVVPHDRLEDVTMELASKLAAFSPFAMKKAKAAIYRAFSTDLDSELKAGAEAQALCLETDYAQEKLKKFKGKSTSKYGGGLWLSDDCLSDQKPGYDHLLNLRRAVPQLEAHYVFQPLRNGVFCALAEMPNEHHHVFYCLHRDLDTEPFGH